MYIIKYKFHANQSSHFNDMGRKTNIHKYSRVRYKNAHFIKINPLILRIWDVKKKRASMRLQIERNEVSLKLQKNQSFCVLSFYDWCCPGSHYMIQTIL